MMERLNVDEDMPSENKIQTKAIQQAQTTVESRNFQTRKSVLEYDDVMNKQREIIYGQRKQVLDGMDVKDTIMNMMATAITNQVNSAFLEQTLSLIHIFRFTPHTTPTASGTACRSSSTSSGSWGARSPLPSRQIRLSPAPLVRTYRCRSRPRPVFSS